MILDMAGVSYPTTYKEQPNAPMFGIASLQERNPAVVSLNGNFFTIGGKGVRENRTERYLAFEMMGTIGLRNGDWKLTRDNCNEDAMLFNLKDDPFEINDLASTHPEKTSGDEGSLSAVCDRKRCDRTADFLFWYGL